MCACMCVHVLLRLVCLFVHMYVFRGKRGPNGAGGVRIAWATKLIILLIDPGHFNPEPRNTASDFS